MSEKMTDEELKKVLKALRDNGLQQAATLLESHIAALTAERDHLESEVRVYDVAATQYAADILYMKARREMVERRWVEARAECSALRERVQALEQERGAERERALAAHKERQDVAAKLRAAESCIAALTSDLAESRASSDDYRHGCEELTRDRATLRGRVTALEHDAKGYGELMLLLGDALGMDSVTGVALVERARRVVAERDAMGRERNEAALRMEAAESRLAAIRQRAREHATVGSIALNAMSLPDAEPADAGRAADSYILGDDARPSAPPEAFTHEKGLDAGVFDDAPLNPDATSEADQPLPEGPLEPADMTNEESGRICADAGVDVETGVAKCLEMVAAKRAEKPAPFRSEDEDPPLLLPQTPARHYPTTSEAFATAQGALHSFLGLIRIHYANRTECDGSMERGCLSGLGALSLLERRMVAMEAALRGCRTHLKCTEGCVCDVCTALVGASAAPPPEDVEERARDVYEAAIARREHQPAALALAVREALRLAPSGTVSASGPCGCGRPEAWTMEEVEQVLRREELGPATARRVREHLAALRRRP